jgi:hypothetical protein
LNLVGLFVDNQKCDIEIDLYFKKESAKIAGEWDTAGFM